MNEWVYAGRDEDKGELIFASNGCTLHVSVIAIGDALSDPAVLNGILKANFNFKEELKNTPPVVELVF